MSRNTRLAQIVTVVLSGLLLLVWPAAPVSADTGTRAAGQQPILFVFDTSGSMGESDDQSVPKLEDAGAGADPCVEGAEGLLPAASPVSAASIGRTTNHPAAPRVTTAARTAIATPARLPPRDGCGLVGGPGGGSPGSSPAAGPVPVRAVTLGHPRGGVGGPRSNQW